MKSDPNSDSEQCSESKLSRVYSAHTLTQPARTLILGRGHSMRWAPCRGRVVVRRTPCRKPCPVVSWSCLCAHAAMLSPLPVTIQKLYRDPSPYCAPCRARCRAFRIALVPCRRALGVVSLPLLRHKGCPKPRYKPLYRDLPWLGHGRARCRTPHVQVGLVLGRIVAVCWPYRRHARPCRGRVLPSHARPCAPCVKIQCTVS